MNQKQRNVLFKCAKQLGQIESDVSSIVDTIEGVKNEEECKLDNMPDSLRDSERGELMEEGIERLDDVLSLLEEKEYSDAADLLNEF